jgi:hypothetical protein
MSAEITEPKSQSQEPDEKNVAAELPAPQADWFLELLVRMAHDDIENGVTLLVGGFLVSGTMISGPKYFEGIGAEYAAAASAQGQEGAESFKQTFAQIGDFSKPPADNSDAPPFAYIHLKDARFFHNSGQPIPANHAVWWRGRLSEVAGFIIGNISYSAS